MSTNAICAQDEAEDISKKAGEVVNLIDNGQIGENIKLFGEALAIDPDNFTCHYEKGIHLRLKERLQTGYKDIE